MNNKAEALMPCPFCGGDARRRNTLHVRCSNPKCDIHTAWLRHDQWNTRKGCAEVARKAVEKGHTLDKTGDVMYEDGFFDGINFSINEINKAFGVSDEET